MSVFQKDGQFHCIEKQKNLVADECSGKLGLDCSLQLSSRQAQNHHGAETLGILRKFPVNKSITAHYNKAEDAREALKEVVLKQDAEHKYLLAEMLNVLQRDKIRRVVIPEASWYFYGFQITFKNIHSEMYS